MSFECTIQTRYSETGQDGIIHHSSYVVYLEVARLNFFKTIGLDINTLEKEGMFCPVLTLSLEYLKPLNCLDEILATVTFVPISKVRFQLDYVITRDGICMTKATTTHCFLNASFKPVAIPTHYATQLEKSCLSPPKNSAL